MRSKTSPTLLNQASVVALTVVSFTSTLLAEDNTWLDGGPSNIWNTTALNWSGTDSDWDNGDNAIFSGGGETVTLGEAITAGTISFNSAGYTIDTNGNALNATSILGTNGFTKEGLGALTLTGVSSNSGDIRIDNGSLVLDNTVATGAQNQFPNAGAGFIIGQNGTLHVKVAGAGQDGSAYVINRYLEGDGTLVLENAGATGNREITLSGINTGFGGVLNITRSSGTLPMRVKANQMADTTQISVANGGQLWDNTASGNTVGYTFTNLAGTGEGGFGALRVAGGVTYTGNITIDAAGGRIGGAGGAGVIATLDSLISGGTLELLGSSNGVTLIVNNNANTQAATTIVGGSSGVVRAGGNTVFGAGTLTQNGAGLSSTSTAARTFTNAYVIGGNVTLGDATNNGKLTFTNTVGLNGAARTITTASDVEFTGAVSNGGINKAGAGILTLSGNSNVLNQATTVQAGTLNINGSTTMGSTTVQGGTLNFGGTTTISGANFGSSAGSASSTINVNAAVANSADTIISQNSAHTTTFNVNNGGTWTQTGRFLLGNNVATAFATLNINAGGTFIFNNTVTAASDAFIVGRDLANGTINLSGSLHSNQVVQGDNGAVGGNGNAGTTRAFNFNGGTFRALSNNASIAGMNSANINAGGGTVDTNGFNIAIGQAFAGSGALNKIGTGTLLLNGVNTYTGATNVTAGTLGGTGGVAGALNVTGTLSPGASIESFASGALTMNNTSTFAYELNSTLLTGDLMVVTGDLNLNGTVLLTLTELADAVVTAGTKLTLINYSGTWNGGTFSGNADDSTFTLGSNTWQIDYNDSAKGGNFNGEQTGLNSVTITVVPEPSMALLGGLGLLGLLRRRRSA